MQTEHTVKLLEFIQASKAKGASDEFLVGFLTRRGWPQDDVYAALGTYWEQVTGLAVPGRAAGGESSRDAFLYLLSFFTLATWSSALGSLLFQLINHWLPDPVSGNFVYNLRTAVTWQMASLAVAFPVFLLAMRTILREAQDNPERLQSGVRKWLMYIALLLTAGAMICDLIWFFDYFLTGELTSRFVLKALTVMLICGVIFAYYLGSLRWDRHTDVAQAKSRSLRFGIGAAVIVAAGFCTGLGIAGMPSEQRHIEADSRRVQDLQRIAYALHSWEKRAASEQSSVLLPPTLTALAGQGISPSQLADPETKINYGYHVKSGTAYELCAAFTGAEEPNATAVTQIRHLRKGRTCFTLDASQPPAW